MVVDVSITFNVKRRKVIFSDWIVSCFKTLRLKIISVTLFICPGFGLAPNNFG